MSRLEEELGDFLGSVLGRVGGSGLASINLPTFYLRLPVASWGVGLSGRPLPLSLSLCWDRYALSVLSHSVRSAFGRYALPLRCVCSPLPSRSLFSVCVCGDLLSSLSSVLAFLPSSSLSRFSLGYHLRCSVSFAVTRSHSHPSGALSFNLSWILVPRLLVRFSLSL